MKKMKIKTSVVFATVVLLLLGACGKYDDGPAISLRSPEKRMIGLWECTSVMIGGVEHLTDYQSDSAYLRFSFSGTKEELFIRLVDDNQSSPTFSSDLLIFNDKMNEMTFELPVNPLYEQETDEFFALIPALNNENVWSINRLSFNEMWISTTFNDTLYALKLSKLDKDLLNP